MQLPIIFPFTHLDGPTLESVHDALGRFEILQLSPGLVSEPVKQASRQGKVVLRFQQKADPDRLERLLEDYLDWAGMFGRDGRNMALYYQQRGGLPPLVDENAPSRIKSRIRQMARQQAGPDAGTDPFMQACLILAMAQYYDRQQEEIRGRLATIAGMERELYAGLKGEDDPSFSDSPTLGAAEDPGAVKTAARLVSWALLAAWLDKMPAFWVTTSQAVMEYMVEKAGPELVHAAALENGLDPEVLDDLASAPGPQSGPSVVDLNKVDPPALVLFRLNSPREKFPFSRMEASLPGRGPEDIILGWLKL